MLYLPPPSLLPRAYGTYTRWELRDAAQAWRGMERPCLLRLANRRAAAASLGSLTALYAPRVCRRGAAQATLAGPSCNLYGR